MRGEEEVTMDTVVETVNSPSLGSANVGKIPMNAIDRIEVVKGKVFLSLAWFQWDIDDKIERCARQQFFLQARKFFPL